jgi:hypothetical protein
MMRSLSLRTRCATASSRGSTPAALWLDAALDALDALDLRARLLVPLLLLRVVFFAAVDFLAPERAPVERF